MRCCRATTPADVERVRRRRWRVLALIVAVLLAGGFFALRAVLQPERLGALLVDRIAAHSGLVVATGEPARLGLWPRLHLALVDLDMRRAAAAPAMLRVARIDVALPLSILWRADSEIGRVDVHGPLLDLDELGLWLNAAADDGPPAPTTLPNLAAALHVRNGRLQSGEFALDGLDIDLSPLRDGAPLTLSIAADVDIGEETQRWQLQLAAIPYQRAQGVALEQATLRLAAEAETAPWISAHGEADLFLPQWLRVELQAELDRRLLAELETGLRLPDALLSAPLQLGYRGPGDLSGELAVSAGEGEARVALRGQPREALRWQGDAQRDPLPPLALEADLPELDVQGLRVEGLKLRLHPAAAPAQ